MSVLEKTKLELISSFKSYVDELLIARENNIPSEEWMKITHAMETVSDLLKPNSDSPKRLELIQERYLGMVEELQNFRRSQDIFREAENYLIDKFREYEKFMSKEDLAHFDYNEWTKYVSLCAAFSAFFPKYKEGK